MSNKGAWKLTELLPESVKRAVALLDDEFIRVNPNHKQVKSPAQQFDESHKRWVEGGRES